MTEAQCKAAHIDLWDWLYHHPSKNKYEWPEWGTNGGQYVHVLNRCFACDLCFGRCRHCLLEIKHCEYSDSEFKQWSHATSEKTRKKYAAIIRDAWREVPV
jgi:hypothetical protein